MPYGRCVTYSYRGDRRQLIERAPRPPRRASRWRTGTMGSSGR